MTQTYTLLTGATGLVGRYLLRDLLVAGVPVVTLVRARRGQSAADRVESILARWEGECGRALPRPMVLHGTLSKPGLGLDDAQTRWLQRCCGRVIHSAASVKFDSDNRASEPWRTNLEGLRHLLEFCRAIGLREFHHLSTAYVAGLREGRVREDDLDVGQRWANAYEESKTAGERLLRASSFLKSVTVYRPSIIVGDSLTGYTSTFHSFYVPLRVGQALCPKVPAAEGFTFDFLSLFGLQGNECKNLVPVDWVSAAVVRIFGNPDFHGRTYHLTSTQPVTVRDMQDVLWTVLGPLVGRKPIEATPESLTELLTTFYEQVKVYRSYWHTDPIFDRTNTEWAIPDCPCPALDRQRLIALARYALDSNFGQPAGPFLRASNQAREWFDGIGDSQRRVAGCGDDPLAVGFEVTGHGGVEWQFGLQGGQITSSEPGLPAKPSVVFHLPWDTFQQLKGGRLPSSVALAEGRALAITETALETRQLTSLLDAFVSPAAGGNQPDTRSTDQVVLARSGS